MEKVIVTGATGFIGVHLIQEWLKEKSDVFAIVRPGSKNIARIPKSDRVHILECEMSNYDMLVREIGNSDYFYHLAWEGARNPYRNDELIQKNNYNGALNAINAAQGMHCSFFLGSGSQAEYGIKNSLVTEESICTPDTAYGKEKLHACKDLKKIADMEGMRFIWTRIFSIYGQYDYPGTLIMSSIQKMKKNEPIDMTQGTQLWDYLHVKDAARAMLMFARSKCPNGIYNIASGDYRPLKEFIQIMKKISGSNSQLNFGAISLGEKKPSNLTPDISKIKNMLVWSPEISFENGILQMLKDDQLF